ncbi:hypothetical protein DSO57_1007617 [Entomophthora muscae]|uniref:Uncharacterized protein n=1 Tax=Entomophthora muscae TaxID=34485 RepID=A0ACC2TUT0_9FUNG|nr:hypothetical protein DSO57_1007617 [Entomophthora muscae]
MFARAALSRTSAAARQLRRSDLYHFENKNGQVSFFRLNLSYAFSIFPFDVKNKKVFAVKFTAACLFASSIPVLACVWQLNK